MYSARIIADSISPEGVRFTTFEAVFPRFLLAEFNTHRMLSRNSASSRAIPPEKMLKRTRLSPFVPEFNHRVKGMGVGDPLDAQRAANAKDIWVTASVDASRAASRLIALDVDKSRVNRLLEPFLWHTALISATDWTNFFALRTHEDAQPEFRKVALMMRDVYDANDPWHCPRGCWHLPLVSLEELGDDPDYPYWKQVSAGRCARVSYLTHDGRRDPDEDIRLASSLVSRGHMSPLEHVARPFSEDEWQRVRLDQDELHFFGSCYSPKEVDRRCRQLEYCGNLRGWYSYRAEIPNEHDFSLAR